MVVPTSRAPEALVGALESRQDEDEMIALLLAAAFYLPPNPTVSPLWKDWSGGFVNFGKGNEQADTNALAHVWSGAACTLAGYYIGDKLWQDGRKGALWGAVGCSAFFVARLFLVHAQRDVRPGYGAELRAGLITSVGAAWVTAVPILVF